MKCPTCGYKLAVYKTLADKQANSVTRYYKCSHCSATAVGHEELISDKEVQKLYEKTKKEDFGED